MIDKQQNVTEKAMALLSGGLSLEMRWDGWLWISGLLRGGWVRRVDVGKE